MTAIKGYLQADFPVRIDSPAEVALFAYDNNSFVVESFRPGPCEVTVTLPGTGGKLRDTLSDVLLEAQPVPTPGPEQLVRPAKPRFAPDGFQDRGPAPFLPGLYDRKTRPGEKLNLRGFLYWVFSLLAVLPSVLEVAYNIYGIPKSRRQRTPTPGVSNFTPLSLLPGKPPSASDE